jgi:outer membrane protein assembly factor BamB
MRLSTLCGLVAALAAPAVAADWPAWRGAGGLGVSPDPSVPTHWTKAENIRWRAALPEPGNSTPVVWGNRVFVTQALKQQNRRTLMCFDRATGKLLWQSGVAWAEPEPTHATNPYASASPVTDGRLVIAWFGSAGLIAYDMDGREVWRRDLGIQKHTWGYGTSPALDGDRVFLNFGPGEQAFLVAVEKKTGKTLWQVDAPAGEGTKFSNWTAADMYGSWSTPLVVRSGGRQELVLGWPRKLYAFDPATGKVLWTCEGLGDLVYPSPLYADGIVVAMGGFGTPSMAVKAGGSGDVTETHRLWRLPKSRQMIGSGVITGGHLYVVDNNGVAECFELATGKVVWTNRLKGSGANAGVWSSPVLNEGKIYVMNKSAEVFIFKASPQFELLATNALEEETNSSVVIAGGDLFLRTHTSLWRGGNARTLN